LPAKGLSTFTFLGYYFFKNHLVVFYQDKYFLVNLNTKQNQIFDFDENKIVDFITNNKKIKL
jgi:hypothetical protein